VAGGLAEAAGEAVMEFDDAVGAWGVPDVLDDAEGR
jgi:hypothetical protein